MYVLDDTHWVFLNTHYPHSYDFRTGSADASVDAYMLASSSICDEDRRVWYPPAELKMLPLMIWHDVEMIRLMYVWYYDRCIYWSRWVDHGIASSRSRVGIWWYTDDIYISE